MRIENAGRHAVFGVDPGNKMEAEVAGVRGAAQEERGYGNHSREQNDRRSRPSSGAGQEIFSGFRFFLRHGLSDWTAPMICICEIEFSAETRGPGMGGCRGIFRSFRRRILCFAGTRAFCGRIL
jgi:hypothetical protein